MTCKRKRQRTPKVFVCLTSEHGSPHRKTPAMRGMSERSESPSIGVSNRHQAIAEAEQGWLCDSKAGAAGSGRARYYGGEPIETKQQTISSEGFCLSNIVFQKQLPKFLLLLLLS